MPQSHKNSLPFCCFNRGDEITIASEDGNICDLPLCSKKRHVNAEHTIYSFLLEYGFAVSTDTTISKPSKAYFETWQETQCRGETVTHGISFFFFLCGRITLVWQAVIYIRA